LLRRHRPAARFEDGDTSHGLARYLAGSAPVHEQHGRARKKVAPLHVIIRSIRKGAGKGRFSVRGGESPYAVTVCG
jgi:hypothetical protein